MTGSDETNIVACGLVGAAFSRPVTIARVQAAKYLGSLTGDKPLFGVNHMITPEIEAARKIIYVIDRGAVSTVIPFENTAMQIRDVTVFRENRHIVPRGDTVVDSGDMLYVFSDEDGFSGMFELTGGGVRRDRFDRILLMGAGRIGTTIAAHLLSRHGVDGKTILQRMTGILAMTINREVTIVEKNYERCRYLTTLFPGARVINADIGDEHSLPEKEYREYDLVIAVTSASVPACEST